MRVPILKTPISFTPPEINAEVTYYLKKLTKRKIIFRSNISPQELLEKGLPEEVLERIKDSLRGYLTLRVGLSREDINIEVKGKKYVIYPKSKNLKFDKRALRKDKKNKKFCIYRVNTGRSRK
ncbi:hypothetical protein ACFLZ4_02000 [Patescibacteria group bacterium]